MQKFIFLITILFAFTVNAEDLTITGSIYDELGNPIPGVSILEKGTQNGSIADMNGHYSIKVTNEQSTLSFSIVGFDTKEVKVGKKRKIDVVLLQTLQKLEEVIVMEDAEYEMPVQERLAGSVAGVMIRGQSSLKRSSLCF